MIRRISSLAQLATAVADLERLLILHEEPVKSLSGSSTKGKRPSSAKNDDPYDKMLYRTYASNRKDAFAKLYLFCFALAKPP